MVDERVESPFTFNAEVLTAALRNIHRRKYNPRKEIDPGLFEEIARIIDSATDAGFADSGASDTFMEQLHENNEVFAAFKAHRMGRDMAAQLLDEEGNLKSFERFQQDVKSITTHQVGQWLRTEYDTAVKRAHRAADMMQYRAEADVLPNLEWLPSTAVNPREEHRIFYHHIWAMDDPFWQDHRPGDQWGCQCDLAPTDKPVTQNRGLGKANQAKPSKGLKGDPSKSAVVFSDDHPYFPGSCGSCPFNQGILNRIFNKEKDCYHCANASKVIEHAKLVPLLEEYKRLKEDENYTDVKIDRKSGGLKATHIGHNITSKGERFFGGRLTSSDLEIECQKQLFRLGHKAILCDESKQIGGNKLPAVDMELDGKMVDIRSITGRGWYSHAMLDKNDQFQRYNMREDISAKVDTLCLYFHDASLFSETKMRKSINYFKFFRNNEGELISHQIRRIICVIKDRDEILEYEVKKY